MTEHVDLQFSYEADVLIVRANGRYLIENVEAAIKQIAAAIEQKPVKAALVDLRNVPGSIAFMDRFELGKLAGLHLRTIPIGAVAREDQLDKHRLALVVARNRGATIELFCELSAAQEWLDALPPPNKGLTEV